MMVALLSLVQVCWLGPRRTASKPQRKFSVLCPWDYDMGDFQDNGPSTSVIYNGSGNSTALPWAMAR